MLPPDPNVTDPYPNPNPDPNLNPNPNPIPNPNSKPSPDPNTLTRCTFATGNVYEGTYKEDKKHGKGKEPFPDEP